MKSISKSYIFLFLASSAVAGTLIKEISLDRKTKILFYKEPPSIKSIFADGKSDLTSVNCTIIPL